MKNATMTVRLPEDLKGRISTLADATHRSQAFVVLQALNEYLDNHEWQVQETIKAVELADSNHAEFVSHADVKAKWEKRLGN